MYIKIKEMETLIKIAKGLASNIDDVIIWEDELMDSIYIDEDRKNLIIVDNKSIAKLGKVFENNGLIK